LLDKDRFRRTTTSTWTRWIYIDILSVSSEYMVIAVLLDFGYPSVPSVGTE
jgi:hypothetical protein